MTTRCADVAAAAGDPLVATAPPATRWLLIEHPGPWGFHPLTGSGLHPGAVEALTTWERATKGRAVLVRRPGRRTAGGPRRWMRVDSRPGHEQIRGGTFTDDRELPAAVSAPGTPVEGPVRLVCAHGRHDTCCAVRGRPVAAALAADDPGRVWECSHVGGCRFAAALVLAPHGFVYGHLSPAEAVEVARAHRAGVLDPRLLRGRSALAPAEQAAQHHARLATAAPSVDALAPLSLEALDANMWRVVLDRPRVTVVLHERRVDLGRPLTCRATTPGWMREFDLVRLEVAEPAARPG